MANAAEPADRPGQRIDKWLFFARFAKSRTLAAQIVAAGKVRVNGDKIDQPARLVRPGDVLTLAHARDVALVRVTAAGERRGPATEARTLYEPVAPAGDKQPT